jgi:hypothetical protein
MGSEVRRLERPNGDLLHRRGECSPEAISHANGDSGTWEERHLFEQSLKITPRITQPSFNRNQISTTFLFSAFRRAAILDAIMSMGLSSSQPMNLSQTLLFKERGVLES